METTTWRRTQVRAKEIPWKIEYIEEPEVGLAYLTAQVRISEAASFWFITLCTHPFFAYTYTWSTYHNLDFRLENNNSLRAGNPIF